jgi:energy-coupling factor transporter ATP-binding protein EcfA2
MISLNSLRYWYPKSEKPALEITSLEIMTGDFLILAGSSGSGKTTLLKAINGLVPHFTGGKVEGEVRVNGMNVLEAGPRTLSQHIGYVTQNPENQALLDRVEPEIAFALENAAVPAQEMRVRVEEVLDLLDLSPLRNRLLTSLSGGERQRVAIASVLALRPQILLLDEPTSQLDPKSAEDVLRSLVRLNEDLGLTVIVSEHRLERVLRYADRVVFLEQGRIQIDDDVHSALREMPQVPPIIELGRILDWEPLPLTVKEGRQEARRLLVNISRPIQSNSEQSADMKQPLLDVSNLQFSFDSQPVLCGIDLQVNPGETVALMGRNGSGKSTVLKCIVGLLKKSAGAVVINGRSIDGRDVADITKNVAYLPQNPDDLLFAESVIEEFQVTLANHGMSGNGGMEKLLTDLGLQEEKESYPRDLSTGQRQRVALGAVTITNPPLLLLDEPTRGLDSMLKSILVDIWRGWMESGMGILLVTHDVELAAKIANRVLILSQGEIIASGSTHDVIGASPLFAPQIARLFPETRCLTVEDVLTCLDQNQKRINHL